MITTMVWEHLEFDEPRYMGGFPKGYEEKLWRLLGYRDPSQILHVFGGKAKIGVRIDINPRVEPDFIMDAHHLEFPDESFEVVICDPPFSDNDNKNKYENLDAKPLNEKQWLSEASRVCKKNGFIVVRHLWNISRPPNTSLWMTILLRLNSHRHTHVVQIHIKDGTP